MHFYAFLLCRCLSLKKYFDISAFTKNIHENMRENVLFQLVLEVRLVLRFAKTGILFARLTIVVRNIQSSLSNPSFTVK